MALFANPFQPKWKRRDESERLAGVEELDPIQQADILLRIALEDPSAQIRRTALNRLEGEAALEEFCRKSSDPDLVDLAQRRLAGYARDRLLSLRSGSTHWEHWLEQVRDERMLQEIVLGGAMIELCLAALERIHDEEILFDLGRKIRGKHLAEKLVQRLAAYPEKLKLLAHQGANKAIRQHARNLLAQIQAAAKQDNVGVDEELARMARCREIVEYARHTGAHTHNFGPVGERLQAMKTELDQLEADPNGEF
ncbi:hypothetical protein D6833_11945, partial [Candidatus Parcubacteria bacterium]